MNEEQARAILEKGEDFLFWEPGDLTMLLDGHFTGEQLMALGWWLVNKPNDPLPDVI